MGAGHESVEAAGKGFRLRTNRSKADLRRPIWARWKRIRRSGRQQPWWRLPRVHRALLAARLVVSGANEWEAAQIQCAADDATGCSSPTTVRTTESRKIGALQHLALATGSFRRRII